MMLKKPNNDFFEFPDIDESSIQTDLEIIEYVKLRYYSFFKSYPSEDLIREMSRCIAGFNDYNKTIESAFEYLKKHPDVIDMTYNRFGRGEFALYLLFPNAKKLGENEKGDVEIKNQRYEIKKIKEKNQNILFGTNVGLESIRSIRLVILHLNELFNSKTYSGNSNIKVFKDEYDKIMGNSESFLGRDKLEKLYGFFSMLMIYEKENRNSYLMDDSHIVKIYNGEEYVHFQLLKSDVEQASKTGKIETTLKKLETKSETDILTMFFDETRHVLDSFLKKYPTFKQYGNKMVVELKTTYMSNNVDILLIDHNDNFILNPKFKFSAISQSFRPEVLWDE